MGTAWGPPKQAAAHLDAIRPTFVGASVHDRERIAAAKGLVAVSAGPGMGIELGRKGVERCRVR